MVANTPMATITTVSMVTPAPTAAAGSNSFERKRVQSGLSDCPSLIMDVTDGCLSVEERIIGGFSLIGRSNLTRVTLSLYLRICKKFL